jgi:two-component system chemotaxis response regulator CheY
LKHSLVVDNSRVIRKVTCKILEKLNFTADEADDASSAIDICRTKMPDAVLIDAHLPNKGEMDFLLALRREKGGDKPFVLICTMENDARLITEALAAGASDFILKPFDRNSLADRLEQAGLI